MPQARTAEEGGGEEDGGGIGSSRAPTHAVLFPNASSSAASHRVCVTTSVRSRTSHGGAGDAVSKVPLRRWSAHSAKTTATVSSVASAKSEPPAPFPRHYPTDGVVRPKDAPATR